MSRVSLTLFYILNNYEKTLLDLNIFIRFPGKAGPSNRAEGELLGNTSGLKIAGSKSIPQVIIQLQGEDHKTSEGNDFSFSKLK